MVKRKKPPDPNFMEGRFLPERDFMDAGLVHSRGMMERTFASFALGGSNKRTVRPWGLPCVTALRFMRGFGRTTKHSLKKTLPRAHSLYNISNSFKRKKVGEIKVWESLEQMRSDCDVRFVHIVHFKS